MFSLSTVEWTFVIVSALIIGATKTGIVGIAILVVPLMASVFPAKESTGILLPLLIFGDIFAVSFYRHHARWSILLRVFPFTIAGVIIGFFFMGRINSDQLRPVIGVIVLSMLVINFFVKNLKEDSFVRSSIFFSGFVGILAGFATMTANAAGPLMAIYLLSMNLDKKGFVGTRAWYFFLINLFKIPFSASLGLITFHSLKFDFMLLPAILVGAFAGYSLVKVIPQKAFELIVKVLTAVGAINLIIS